MGVGVMFWLSGWDVEVFVLVLVLEDWTLHKLWIEYTCAYECTQHFALNFPLRFTSPQYHVMSIVVITHAFQASNTSE